MAQSSISSYFITRKRTLEDDIVASKKKINNGEIKEDKITKSIGLPSVRQGITPQRKRSSRRVQMQNVDGIEAPKIVNFFLGGSMSPQKKSKTQLNPIETPKETIIKTKSDNELKEQNNGMQTPTKKPILTTEVNRVEKTLMIPTNTLNTDEIKKKLRKSAKLTELKTSLNKLRNGFDKLDQMELKRKEMTKAAKDKLQSREGEAKSLKPFKNIELEILSPKKGFTSPIKLKNSPMKNTLIGSPKLLTPKKLLFSPTKSPVKAPAYERFQNLTEAGAPSLQLPFKYRYLLEVFKAVDTVCAMFFNRKEKITFKKMKPAVQRILRKNFYETHLAQIQKLMPNAFKFVQEKTRNYGSTSKQDYYQLVITPNIKCDNDEVSELVLSPQILIQRYRKMTDLLTDLVFEEHAKFLQTLDIPMTVTRGALKRWHPDFPIESVPDIEQGELPLPPNVERFSSAKDILSTARNLFNCSTAMERALERLEAKKQDEKSKELQNGQQVEATKAATPPRPAIEEKKKQPIPDSSAALLKGVPQSLLDKIRAKQAAKALDTMTRRPSQERDAAKYSRLPELARHVRNVFVTEKKGVLPQENVLIKIQNSYKACASMKELEELLKLLSKEMPRWITFHEIRNMMFIKLNRESDLTEVVQKLQELASQKSQIQ
ncbi:DNA replication factor Cdt1 isoform X2 [Chironomus tepperi]|uniref:DNA replication factor Cdt1 isoform X2 n=1 Tax=Chironomus tepperi TaxID=113505 RepID=UPI00391F258E